MTNKFFKKSLPAGRQGFTLIETLVAILLLMTAIAGPLTIAYKGFSTATVAKDQITAFFLAQDALEYIRFARDTNRLTNTNWTTGTISLSNCIAASFTTDTYCYFDSTGQNPSSASPSSCPSGVCSVMYYDTTAGTYQYDTTDQRTIFTRYVRIVALNTDEIIASTTVVWTGASGINRSVTLFENLLNWP